MIIDYQKAFQWYASLPPEKRIATLHPDYVLADAKRNKSLEPVFIGYQEDEWFWYQAMHRSVVPGTDFYDLQSPYGYGGVCTNCRGDFGIRARNYYEQWCRDNRILVELARPHPMLKEVYYGDLMPWRGTVAIDLSGIRYDSKCRNMIRKAENAGLEVFEWGLDNMPRFAGFYRSAMDDLGASEFYHFNDEYFEALAKLPFVHLFVCEDRGEWLSAALFLCGSTIMEYHLSATSGAGRKLAATNMLIDQVAQWSQTKGLEWLYLGGGTDESPDNSLLQFKKSFSEVLIPYAPGYKVYRPDAYNLLKEETGKSERILFYRDNT